MLFEHDLPVEPFAGPVGSAAGGASGIVVPMPEGNRFYLLSSSSAACGPGPRRLCAHDRCVTGDRLDSACDHCVAAICAATPACCESGWNGACVDQVLTVCDDLPCPGSAGACAHAPCTTGAPLAVGCDDPPVTPSCVSAVCAASPACCTVAWDEACVSLIRGACGVDCGD